MAKKVRKSNRENAESWASNQMRHGTPQQKRRQWLYDNPGRAIELMDPTRHSLLRSASNAKYQPSEHNRILSGYNERLRIGLGVAGPKPGSSTRRSSAASSNGRSKPAKPRTKASKGRTKTTSKSRTRQQRRNKAR